MGFCYSVQQQQQKTAAWWKLRSPKNHTKDIQTESRYSMSFVGQEKERGDGEQQKVRLLHTHHRVTLTALFEALKNKVCPSSQSAHNCEASSDQRSPAKWKILDHAMGFLLEKEAYLSKLLALKELYLQEDGGPRSLEDVQEQYRRLYSEHLSPLNSLHIGGHSCTNCVPDMVEGHKRSEVDSSEEETDELPQSQSSVPNIQEFEGYLFFYSETLELLLRSGVLTPDQMGLSVVSEAISDLWRSLPPERRAKAQQHVLDQNSVSWEGQTGITASVLTCLNQPASHVFEEDLLQDAYDVVQRDMDAASANRPAVLQSCDYERLRQIYQDISGFIKNHMAEDQELPQVGKAEDLPQAAEYEEHLLRCSEIFDEDF